MTYRFLSKLLQISPIINQNHIQPSRLKVTINTTLIPVLKDEEIDEQHVRGSGPGGQSVNKTANAVVLRHLPTGIVVKCHATRSMSENRKLARELLISRLDNLYNGDESVEAQKKRASVKKLNEMQRRQKKSAEMKKKWKEENELN